MIDNKTTEKSLQNELNSMKVILNEVGAYIYTKDLKGRYTFANNLVLDLFEATLDEVIGKDDSSFFDLEISKELIENDKRVLEDGENISEEEVNIIKSTGETCTYWTVKKPLYDDEENIIGMCGISTDISERKKLEEDNKNKTNLLTTVLDNIDAYVYMKDENRNFKYVNSNVAKLFGYDSVDEVIGKQDIDVLPKDVADGFWEMDKEVFSSNEKKSAEEIFSDEQGTSKYYWSIKLPIVLEDKTKTLIGFSSDITEIQLLKEELRVLSITDHLTGAFNRRHFEDKAHMEFDRSLRYDIDMSILVFDIDDFKVINDFYGHKTGDEVLKDVSINVLKLVRNEDTFCRIGGEEFAIILPHTNILQAEELGERIYTFFNNNLVDGLSECDDDIKVTVSIGVSSIKNFDESYEKMFLRADDAMYKAKKSGKNRICIK